MTKSGSDTILEKLEKMEIKIDKQGEDIVLIKVHMASISEKQVSYETRITTIENSAKTGKILLDNRTFYFIILAILILAGANLSSEILSKIL